MGFGSPIRVRKSADIASAERPAHRGPRIGNRAAAKADSRLKPRVLVLALAVFVGATWLDALGAENLGRGLKEPTAEQRAWLARHFPRVQKVLPNKLALARLNAERRARGLQPSPVLPGQLPDVGRELAFSAAAAASSPAGALAQGALTPSAVDNSASAAFPPIGNQGKLGSCAAWSTTYYQLTYETALARGLVASGGDNAILCSPKWTYNMANGGVDEGITFPDAYVLLLKNGACKWAEFPYDGNYLAWCLSTAAWRNAIQARPTDPGTIQDSDPEAFIADLKTQLANGHVLTFGTYVDSWYQAVITGGPHKGAQIATCADFYDVGAHAMTLVGYDDGIWCDLNGNGAVEPGEMGAFKVANSWGTSDWNSGFRWVAYDAVRPTSTVPDTATWPPVDRSSYGIIWDMSAFTLTAQGAYTPSLVAEFTLTTDRREEAGILLGIGDTTDSAPTATWVSGALAQQGGPYAFNGTATAVTATFCLDFTDLGPAASTLKRYFLGVVDAANPHPLTVSAYRLTDAAGNVLGMCTQVPKVLDNDGVWLYIDFFLPTSDPPQVTDAAPGADPVSGTATTLSATAIDDGGEPNLTYTWSVVSAPAGATVTFTPNGTNAAKNCAASFTRAGSYALRVTAKDQTDLTDTGDVAFTVDATVTTITVLPANAAVAVDDTRPFAATARDQFGQPVDPQPTFDWSVSGGGTIDPAGLFQAGDTTGGPYTVKASASEVNGTASVTVKTPGSNSPPVAVDDDYSVEQNGTLTVVAPGVLTNDTDPDGGDTLTAVWDDGPYNGSLDLQSDGSFTYTPTPGFYGTDIFTYKVNDGTEDSAPALVVIAVTLPAQTNTPPVAHDDAYSVDHDMTLIVDAPGVLTNDTDADGDTLHAIPDSLPGNGSLTLSDDGSLSYTPDPGFHGVDLFTYRAYDGTDYSAPAIVLISVNTPPVAVDDAYTTDYGKALTVTALGGVLANDSDADNDPLTAVKQNGPWNGSIVFNAAGSFTYTPNKGFSGADVFTYKAYDGIDYSAAATVVITVKAPNTPPDAVDDAYHIETGKTLTVAAIDGVLANDTDAEKDPLTAVKVLGPFNGTLTLSSNGSFTYKAEPGFLGTDTFLYKASDGKDFSTPATVRITVTPPDTPPVAANDAYSVDRDQTLTVAAPGVLENDTDAELDPLTAAKVTGPANGSLTLNADGSFTYTPKAGYTGPDSFTYKANDGQANSNTATVTLTVNVPTNTPPVAVNDAYSLVEDTTLTVDAASGVLANDTDAQNDPLTAVRDTGPWNGTLALNDDGSFTYTPYPGYVGVDVFTYKANDGQADSVPATVVITVTRRNTPPVAVDDAYTVDQDGILDVSAPGLLENDTDAEGDPLTVSKYFAAAHGALTVYTDGSFTYAPDAGYAGIDSFTYDVTDGMDESNFATVTIVVNGPPVATPDVYAAEQGQTLTVDALSGVLANDSDPNGDTLTALLDSGPWNGTLNLNADGSFDYTPNPGFHGTDLFTYRASDGSLDSDPALVILNVAANQSPVAGTEVYTLYQGTSLTEDAPGVLANASDPEGDPLTAVPGADPLNGTLTLNPDGSFDYTPDPGFHGIDLFTYKVSDGTTDSAPGTVILVVEANSPPVATDDAYAVAENDTLLEAAPGVLANDTDADGDPLTAVLDTPPANGTLHLSDDGSFDYTPDPGFTGTDSFTYHANDGKVDGDPATVTLTVDAPPVAEDDAYDAAQGVTLTVDAPGVLENDTDAEGDPLTAVLDSPPANGTLNLNDDGSFDYTPDPGFVGTDTFTYYANDGIADSNIATVTITVPNSPPVAADDEYTVAQGDTLVEAAPGILANDTDADGDPLTAVLDDGPFNGTLNLNDDGSFDYTPALGFFGTDVFIYHANDGIVDSNFATVVITVTPPLNSPPIAEDDEYTVEQDTTLIIDAPGVLENDIDADGDPLTAVLDHGPWNGVLNLNDDGSFDYTPNAGFVGTDTFTYHANDGTTDSNIATVAIIVTPPDNSPPVAQDDSYTVEQDTTLTIDAPGVLENDTDVDGDPLTAVLDSDPANGTLNLNADGSFDYTPDPGFVGTDSFTYHANDGIADSGSATVTIDVTAPPGPVAVDDTYTAPQVRRHHRRGTPLKMAASGVLANDTDPDALPLTAVLVQPPTNGKVTLNADGSFTYTPRRNYLGTDTFTYKATNGTAESAPATVTLNARYVVRLGYGKVRPVPYQGGWVAVVSIKVKNSKNERISGAIVQGHWSGAATGSTTRTTCHHGWANFGSAPITGAGTATFTVDSILVHGVPAIIAHGATVKSVTGP